MEEITEPIVHIIDVRKCVRTKNFKTKKQAEKLFKRIERHKDQYIQLDFSNIEDATIDALSLSIEKAMKKYPEIIDKLVLANANEKIEYILNIMARYCQTLYKASKRLKKNKKKFAKEEKIWKRATSR
jgi:hypothetical protein